MFDALLATLVVVSVAYGIWRWSIYWPTGLCVAFVLNLACVTSIYLMQDSIPLHWKERYSPVLVIAVPTFWLCCVIYSSGIASRRLFGENRQMLLPLSLIAGLTGLSWWCWPQDFFQSDRKQSNIRVLVEFLANDNPHMRSLALFALRELGPYDESTTSAILQAMSDSDDQVRSKAISLVRALGPSAIKAVPILRNEFIRHGGCTSDLAALGPIAREVVPDLKEKLPTSDGYGKLGICNALWKIDGNATLVVPALIELLDDEFDPIRRDAATLLGEIGPKAAEAVPLLQAMVDYVPKADSPAPDDGVSAVRLPPRKGTEAEFYPQIRNAAQVALKKIVRPQ